MTYTLWWLEWHLWHNQALGYHLVNVLLHALSALLLWRVLKRLQIPGAMLAAAIFALHPVNVESVAWISEGKNTLAMFFYAGTVLSWLKFEDSGRKRWYGLALAGFAFALFSKTAVAPLPVVLLGLAWWRRGRMDLKDVWRLAPFFALALALGLVTLWFHSHRAIGDAEIRTDGFWSRLAVAGRAVWFYLYKAVLPLDLSFVYPRWQTDPRNVWTYVPLLLLVAAFVFCWRRRQSWGAGLFFGLAYFVVMLLPVLGFLNIYFMLYSLVADHWEYFAIIGPISVAALLIRRPVVIAALLLALGALTWRQCDLYTTPEKLWLDTLRRNPDSWMAHDNLGQVYFKQGRMAEAIGQFQKTLDLKPDFAEAHDNLANVLGAQGKQDEAIVQLLEALKYKPQFDQAHYNLGLIYSHQGLMKEAVNEFRSAIKLNPRNDKALANLGMTLAQQGRLNEAMDYYRQALAVAPDNPQAHNALGRALETRNKLDEAAGQYSAAIALKPDFAEAHENLGAVLAAQGNFAQAEDQLELALKLQPSSASIHYNLGNDLVGLDKLQGAADQYAEAVRLQPDYLEAHFNLALTFVRLGQRAAAIDHYRKALDLANARHSDLAEKIQSRLRLYESGAALHEPAPK